MRYFIDPFGCVKNQVDAENMMAVLNGSGWSAADGAEDADLIIVNSCGFIESAKQESINAVIGWRRLYPEKKILLAGCLAQRYAASLAEALPEASAVFGNANPAEIGAAAAGVLGKNSLKKTPSTARAGLPAPGQRPLLSMPGSAYIKIGEGCNNRCTFCAIPLIRGGLRSRPVTDILEECQTLLARGVKELNLIGQDITSYGLDISCTLPELLSSISELKGSFWVRLLYMHPDHFPPEIPELIKADGRFLPYFDIPFQHASAKILAAMNRRGNAEAYLGLIAKIRAVLPGAVIRSTFMTGFPGETEEDFQALLDFQEKAGLDWLGCFAYSREEDTPAWSMKPRVSKKTAKSRKRVIEERQIPITENQMNRFVGKEFGCLVEEKIEGEDGLYLGRLPCQAPEVDGLAVISSGAELRPGALIRGKVFRRVGIDLEVKAL
jgi:ribosomal protein S12 methylthiotransferase